MSLEEISFGERCGEVVVLFLTVLLKTHKNALVIDWIGNQSHWQFRV